MATALKFHNHIAVTTDNLSHEQWLTQRRNGIGGSDLAAICGLSKWRSAYHVYLEKLDAAPEQQWSEATEWGTRLEPLIPDKFASNHPEWAITKQQVIYCHPEQSWALGNIARMIICPKRGRGILEIKTASEFLRHEWDDGNIADYYYVQLQWYLFVTGLDWGYFATLIGGNKYREYEVTRDEELIEQLVRLASGFWHEYVLQNIAPPVDDSEACQSLLHRLYPTGKDATTLLPDESEHIETYFGLKEQIKELETALTGVENHFKNLLGCYEVGTVASYMVKWQNRSRTSVDTKQLKELYPDVYAQCLKQTAFRQFSIEKEKMKHVK